MRCIKLNRFRKSLQTLPAIQAWLCLLACVQLAGAGDSSQAESNAPVEAESAQRAARDAERAEELLGRMTLEEQIGQMVLFTVGGTITGPPASGRI